MEDNNFFDEKLDREWDIPTVPDGDIRMVRKSLRRRSTLTVLTSLVLAAAVLVGTVYLGIPAAEKLYWDPDVNTLNIEYTNDLELTMIAYSELFSPSQTVSGVIPERTGFASYSLTVQLWENYGLSDTNFRSATLKRGKLEFPLGFWEYNSANIFERASYPVYEHSTFFHENVRGNLEPLPEYVQVRAAVSFPEDLDMEQLLAFKDSLEGGYIKWVGIRNAPEDQQCYPLCGMKPFMGGKLFDQVNEYYPCFDIKAMETTAENLETHFKALLQFSLDQHSSGTGIDVGMNLYANYYEGVLNYVEENGVMTYGCYLVASPQQLLELLDSGTVSQVWPIDAWIAV